MVALFCCLLPAFSITGEHPVLIISSYNPDAGRTSGNISDFMEEFQRLGGTNTIALENMNCKSFSESPLWERRMAELLAKYQGDKSPALIVLIGQEAWAAYLSLEDSICGNTPVVSALSSRNAILLPGDTVDLKTWMPESVDFFTDFPSSPIKAGFVYEYDVEANINMIKQMYPGTKNIAFVSDNSYGGVAMQAYVVKEMQKFPELNLILLDGRVNTIYTICDRLHELPENTAILMGTWRVDMNDGYFMRNATYAMMEAAPTLPTFSLSSVGLGYWAVAGVVPAYRALGKEMARQSYRLLTTSQDSETHMEIIPNETILDGKLTAELQKRIEETWDNTLLEDIYLPYKPKRKTRAEAARQKGLEPLATLLMLQRDPHPEERAANYVKGDVKNVEDALKGARDIIAEHVSEDERARNSVRNAFARQGILTAKVVKGKEEEATKYRDYFDCSESLKRCNSHRLLAIRRAEAEGLLKVSISPDDEECVERLERQFVRSNNPCGQQVAEAVQDSYKRLLKPSIETEFATQSKERADEEAIKVFAENLRQLLLASPLGQKRVMGIDPGFRTGCKVVCLDAQGNLLHNENIYPHPPVSKQKEAFAKLQMMIESYKIDAVAIGNGTASRETEEFLKHQRFNRDIQIFIVSEQGASIYSASKIARDEFPDYDITVRGAVSIGRRLMDPLAELVKIDPKSIGVGQYQHDVDQTKLKKSLDQTVENCVNLVGVNLNTASSHLLTYISGLGPQLAQNIVNYRAENGAFTSRKELMKVPRMGAKAFEQCAGFLRIPQAKNPLDNTAVHPESYCIVEQMAKDLGCSVAELIASRELRLKINPERYLSPTVGMPTLKDILQELDKPGRDPRGPIKIFEFDKNVRTINDLREGMELPGIVGNITNFGAFVDIGIKENGLVHLSQLADRFISDPNEVVSIHQHIRVKVLSIDMDRKRIQLTMKGVEQN
jgi:protein Tex